MYDVLTYYNNMLPFQHDTFKVQWKGAKRVFENKTYIQYNAIVMDAITFRGLHVWKYIRNIYPIWEMVCEMYNTRVVILMGK